MVNSRKKGNAAERYVCKTLSKYFNGKFERRSMGYNGCDIICPDDFQWAPEVKDNKQITLKHLFAPTKLLKDFWQQALFQAKKNNKVPLLVVKIEGMWFCWMKGEPLEHQWHEFDEWCENYGTKTEISG
jgi:hypothetical protein